ncbi:MAG TPA: hypothetical protein ENL27_00695 [Candidatus Parcubacteria bacterium]|nr:hypothetical protein [Candidatus Parcubacteria bacterium]
MNIIWYGQTCFRIIIPKNGKNEQVGILTDPLNKESGFRSPKLEADIFLFTNEIKEKKEISKVNEQGFVIAGPGEYDAKGIYFQGLQAETKNQEKITIYAIEAEGLKIGHFGKMGQKELSAEQMEIFGGIDVLIIPVGGGDALNAEEAVKIITQIEPKIIIPMYYRTPKIKTKLDGVEKFLKEVGIKSVQPLPKISIKKKDINEDEAKIIILEP